MYRMNVQTSPELTRMSLGTVSLNWSRHAIERCIHLDIGMFPQLTVAVGTVVEIEREGNCTCKLVVRSRYDREFDIVTVLVPMSSGLFNVVTAYLNERSDKHSSLDTSRLGKVA